MLSPAQLAFLWWTAAVGAVITVIGTNVTSFFAADASTVQNLQSQMKEVPKAISTGNTEQLTKSMLPPDKLIPPAEVESKDSTPRLP